MADNTTLNTGSGGDTIATDDIAGIKHQRIKVEIGADGAASDVHAGNPMPVRLGDGTNQVSTLFDVDSGAGSQHVEGVSLRKAASGGSVELGTAADPIRTDPTGTTTQPVSAASLPLPSGAAQEHTAAGSPHAARLTDGTAFYKATTPADTQPVSAASLPLPTGAASETTLAALNTKVATAKTADYDTGAGTDTVQMLGLALPASGGAVAGGTSANPVRTDPTGTTAQPVTDNGGSLTVDGSVTTAGVDAHDAAITANPVTVGGRASDAVPTAVSADGDAVRAWLDRRGATKVAIVDDAGDSAMDGTSNAVRVNVVAGGAGDGAILDGVSAAIKATVLDYVNSNPLAVRLTDTNGDYVSAGGGTQYTEDVASAVDPIGTQLIARRRDALATETTTDGDNTAANCTGKGELYVKHVDAVPVTDNAGSLTTDTPQLPASLVGGRLDANVGAWLGSTAPTVGQKTAANSVPVVLASDHAAPANKTASGALGALNAAVTMSGEGLASVAWEIDTGNLVGTVVFEATLDDTNWFAIDAVRLNGTVISSTTSFADRGSLTSNGYSQVRLRVSAYTSGTSNARLEGSVGASVVRLGQQLPAGTNNIGDVDVASIATGDNTVGRVKLTDGTDVASVTAAGRLEVDGSGVTQPISAASLPLPTGASTLAEQQTQTTALQLIDDTVHAANAALGKVMAVGGQMDDTSTVVATEGNVSAARVTADRALHVQIRTGANEAGTSGNPLRTDPTGTTTQPVSGTVTANAGTGSFTVAQATAANLKGQVQGEAAHDAAVAGNPVLVAARANTSEPGTAVADGDATHLWADKWGRIIVAQDHPPKAAAADAHGPYTENQTASGDQTIIAAPGASTSIVVTGFWLSNQGTAKVRVALTEGAAGTARYRGTLAADGGGVVRDRINWVLPANTALVMNLGAAGDVDVSVDYYVQATP